MLAGDEGNYEMKIFNMLGQVVATERIYLLNDQSMTADIANLPSGNYVVLVSGDNGNYKGRFVKE